VDLDPRRLGVLAAVARTGGVLAAAETLHVTPSAVSQQLARLEREAGVALVVRGGRHIELTAVGAALAEHGRRITEELGAAAEAVATLTRAITGTVTVVSFPTAVAAVVAPVVAALQSAHPGLTLRVLDLPEDAGIARLRAGTVDLVLLEQDAGDHRPAPRGLRDLALLDDPYVVVLPADRALPHGGRGTTGLRAALELEWIAGPPGSATRSVLDRLGRDAGVRARIAHETLEFPAVLALVAAGLGLALVPRMALPAPENRRTAGLRTLDLPGLGARRLLARHRSSREEPSAAVRTVLDALAARAASLS
jgi:DNA-binding transcriptional LysR family regulator